MSRRKLLKEIKEGDEVMRVLAGVHPMHLRVTAVDAQHIHCGPWKFDRRTGGEVDEQLEWDGVRTGSYLEPRKAG
jgi:hypothetical protein